MCQGKPSVIHVPNYSDDNPYQDNLVEGSRSNGVDATIVDSDFTYVFSLFRGSRRANIVHIHWIEALYRGDGWYESILKGLLFSVDLLLAQLLGITVVWTVHNTTPHEVKYPRLYAAIGHVVSRLSAAIVVHDESTIDEIIAEYRLSPDIRDKCAVVPHGNYIENYPNNVTQTEARSELGLKGDETVYLFLGQIRSYKGVPALIDAFSALEKDDARLIIAGNPRSEAYHRRLSQRVSEVDGIDYCPEFIPDDKLQFYFNAADVAVFPFRSVLTSGSVLLALSFGCPAVVPRLGNVGEITQGTISYDPDSETVLEGLRRANDTDLEKLGNEARAFAKSVDWNSIGEKLVSVYQEACVDTS